MNAYQESKQRHDAAVRQLKLRSARLAFQVALAGETDPAKQDYYRRRIDEVDRLLEQPSPDAA